MTSVLGHSVSGDLLGSYDATVWIPVRERLPLEQDGEVLVRMPDSRCEIAWATYWHGASNDFAGWCFRDPDEDEAPTHWMPIPPASTGADTARPGSDEQDAPASPAPPQGEREAFEADAEKRYPGINLRASRTANGYINPGWHDDWLVWRRAWNAARASLSASTPSAAAPEFNGWYCAHCQRGVDSSEVTFHEQHQECGRVITNDRPPRPAVSAEARDAARYRWLRSDDIEVAQGQREIVVQMLRLPFREDQSDETLTGPELDAAIDAAMAPPADNKENGNV